MLRTCLTICHLTNFIIIHGVTKERSLSIPGPSQIQQQGVWLRLTYLTNVANLAPKYNSCYHGRTCLHLFKMFSIPDVNAREVPTGRVTQQTMRLLAANGPPTPYRLDSVAREQAASQQVRPQETRGELTLALLDQDADEQGLTLQLVRQIQTTGDSYVLGGGGTQGASVSEGDPEAQAQAAAEIRV
jgi:hypothetical protein